MRRTMRIGSRDGHDDAVKEGAQASQIPFRFCVDYQSEDSIAEQGSG
jgi:hypothetical protein